MPLDPQPADSLSDSACVWLREMNRNSLLQNYSSGKTSTESRTKVNSPNSNSSNLPLKHFATFYLILHFLNVQKSQSNAINFHSTRSVRIFPSNSCKKPFVRGKKKKAKKNWMNQFSRRATRHLRSRAFSIPRGNVTSQSVPRGVRACPPTRLEEVHPSRVHRSRRKAVVGSPSSEHDGGHPRHEVSSWVHLAPRVPSSSSSSSPSTGKGNSVQRTADTDSSPLTLVAPPHLVASLPPVSPRCH